MKIIKIRLTGFKRFILNEIHNFEMTMTQAVQIILGTNGSGKSSLLDQLTPLPGIAADFQKTGGKEIWIESKGSMMILSSVFQPSQKHSFIKDGVELNDGGTITIQRELVKQHFGITPEVHSLVMGYESFHAMSPNRRKDWFVKLCDTDYSYAIKVYGRVREKLRDVQGAAKMAKRRLVSEVEKQLKGEEEQILLDDVKLLHKRLDELMALRPVKEQDVDVLSMRQSNLDLSLTKQLKARQDINTALADNSGLTDAGIAEVLRKLQHQTAVTNSILASTSSDYDANQKRIAVLIKADQQTTQSIQNDLDNLDRQILKLRKDLSDEFSIDESVHPQHMLSALDACEAQLIDIASNILENQDRRFSRTRLEEAKERLAHLNRVKANLAERMAEYATKIQHMENHKNNPDIACPNCQHQFSLKYDPVLHRNLHAQLQDSSTKLEKEVLPEIAQLEKYFEECSTYAAYFRQFANLKAANFALTGYFNYYESKDYLYHNANGMIVDLSKIRRDIQQRIDLLALAEAFTEKAKLLESLKTLGGGDLRTLQELAESQRQKISDATNRLEWLNARRRHYLELSRLLNRREQIVRDVKQVLKEKDEVAKLHMHAIRTDLMHALIKNVQSILGSKEYILQQSRLQKSVVQNLETQIAELALQEEALQALVQTLSPTDGLIAEGLLGFINEFVGKMNSLIEKVWNYPMVIVPCAVDENAGVDLDYRFPLQLQQNADPVPDVSRGSRGQIEICDLAFKLTAMAYLGLTDGPLILDEMGSALDHEHKSSLIFLIKNLIEHETFTQVCLVSHDYSQYTSLSNAEMCVLCDRNIMLPPKSAYNQHVKMT